MAEPNITRDMAIFDNVRDRISNSTLAAINLSERLKRQLNTYEADVTAHRANAIELASSPSEAYIHPKKAEKAA